MEIQPAEAGSPGACPRCGRRYKTRDRVASCRWHEGLAWVSGNPPARGDRFACVSFCRHPCRREYITVTLYIT
jgi:hypothetical protein